MPGPANLGEFVKNMAAARALGKALFWDMQSAATAFADPQLFVPNGHAGDTITVTDANLDGRADDVMIEIPAVGAGGGPPLPGFLEGPFAAVP